MRAQLTALVMNILGEDFEKSGEQLTDKVMRRIEGVKASIPVISPASTDEAMQQIQAVAIAGITGIIQTTGDVLGLIADVVKEARRGK